MQGCDSCTEEQQCATFDSCCLPGMDGAARRLAGKTLDELGRATQCEFSGHYEDGFEQAFDDIAEGGKGVLPPAPPSKYWAEKYRCPEGAAKVEEWYSGYHAGVQHAYMRGVQHCNYVRSRQDFIRSTLDCGCDNVCASGAGVTFVGDQCQRCQLPVEHEICNIQSNCCRQPGCDLIAPNCSTLPGTSLAQPAENSPRTAPSPLSVPAPAPGTSTKPTTIPPAAPPASPQPVPAERPNGPAAQRFAPHQQLGYEVEQGGKLAGIQPLSGTSPSFGHGSSAGQNIPVQGRPLSWGAEQGGNSASSGRIDSWLFK
ncbi:hypothetical protein Pla110_39610 [Polystyrenella longa]|uniref:Uncharacterized protein n=2 Tax=Polystyrenella longa TaxID=2528007 RepID=A0A518CSL3_9PLAN|nr:hypothetical protein Pla110_39610 [Polystyrenella longa]